MRQLLTYCPVEGSGFPLTFLYFTSLLGLSLRKGLDNVEFKSFIYEPLLFHLWRCGTLHMVTGSVCLPGTRCNGQVGSYQNGSLNFPKRYVLQAIDKFLSSAAYQFTCRHDNACKSYFLQWSPGDLPVYNFRPPWGQSKYDQANLDTHYYKKILILIMNNNKSKILKAFEAIRSHFETSPL